MRVWHSPGMNALGHSPSYPREGRDAESTYTRVGIGKSLLQKMSGLGNNQRYECLRAFTVLPKRGSGCGKHVYRTQIYMKRRDSERPPTQEVGIRKVRKEVEILKKIAFFSTKHIIFSNSLIFFVIFLDFFRNHIV